MTHGHLIAPRRVVRGPFAIAPSCLGFGCASLGSRIGAAAGLRALETAFDAGVTWFDVAPAYGAGEAEALLAPFLRRHRDQVCVTTKVGLAPPARVGAMRLAYGLARPMIGALGGLRRVFRKMSATRNVALPVDGALVTASIEASLRRLGTDRIDTFALHDPDPADIVRDDVLRALENILARGQARRIAVAGSRDACRIAKAAGAPYTGLQMSVEDFAVLRGEIGDEYPVVLHSVFGVDGMRDRLLRTLADDTKRRRLASAGYAGGADQMATALLMDHAFALNPNGIVLASMLGAGHLEENLARAALRPAQDAPALLAEMLA